MLLNSEVAYAKQLHISHLVCLLVATHDTVADCCRYYAAHPQSRGGVFTWTAENSFSCQPPFCIEKIVAAAQNQDEPDSSLFECNCNGLRVKTDDDVIVAQCPDKDGCTS